MGSNQSIPKINTETDIEPIDQLFNYSRNNDVLDVEIVSDLRSKFLSDNGTDDLLCKWASSQGLLNLVRVLVIDLKIERFDEIVNGAIAYNRINILQWLFYDYNLEIKTEWLCFPYKSRTGCDTYDENLLEIFLSKASTQVIEEAYVLTNQESGYFSFALHEIMKYCPNYKKINWQEIFKKMDNTSEGIRIVEAKLISYDWAKNYVEEESVTASYNMIEFFEIDDI